MCRKKSIELLLWINYLPRCRLPLRERASQESQHTLLVEGSLLKPPHHQPVKPRLRKHARTCAVSQRMPSKNFGSCSATAGWTESSFGGRSHSRTTSSILFASSGSWSSKSTEASMLALGPIRRATTCSALKDFRSRDTGTTICCETRKAYCSICSIDLRRVTPHPTDRAATVSSPLPKGERALRRTPRLRTERRVLARR